MAGIKKAAALILMLVVVTPMAASDEKVVVIGLDGASHDLINQCLERNDLENIEAMRSTGSLEPMDSTLPSLTPVALSSFLTGKNPGGTGVYGFEKRGPFSYDTSIVNSRDLETILPEKVDGKSVMINVPMTYPAPEINGVVVSGFPGSTSGKYAHPPTIKKDLEEINYSVNTAGTFEEEDQLEEEVFKLYEKRRNLSLDYMDRHDWNFFMVMFTGDARLQHFSSPGECEGSIDRYYQELDDFVGKVNEKTGENTTIILMSNHGFKELDKKIYLYTFLKENGYLSPKQPDYWKHRVQDFLGDMAAKIGLKNSGEISGQAKFSDEYMEEVNWEETQAYTGSFYNGQIFINLEGREPEGSVKPEDYEEVRDNIVEDLKQLEDPETGEKVVTEVYTKDEIYSGSEAERVPDIVFEAPGYNHIARFGFGQTFLNDPVESSSPVKTGFVASNQEINTENNTILDLSTTVAATLGFEFGEGRNMFEE